MAKLATWKRVDEFVDASAGIAWNGCHKIYVLRDAAEVERVREMGYGKRDSALISRAEQPHIDLNLRVQEWYEESCGLRFIDATRVVEDKTEFTTLIAQFDAAA